MFCISARQSIFTNCWFPHASIFWTTSRAGDDVSSHNRCQRHNFSKISELVKIPYTLTLHRDSSARKRLDPQDQTTYRTVKIFHYFVYLHGIILYSNFVTKKIKAEAKRFLLYFVIVNGGLLWSKYSLTWSFVHFWPFLNALKRLKWSNRWHGVTALNERLKKSHNHNRLLLALNNPPKNL